MKRVVSVVAVVWYLVWIASMVHLTFTLSTWTWRIVAGVTTIFIARRLWAFLAATLRTRAA